MYKKRIQQISEILEQDESVETIVLAKRFSVSQMTIRRDLDELDRAGLIKRVYGGAQIIRKSDLESSFLNRKVVNRQKKIDICKVACKMIQDGDSIFLDASSTCSQLAMMLPEDKRVTVFTNSLDAIIHLSNKKGVSLVSLGGELSFDKNTFDGLLTLENSSKLSVDRCFFSCAGFNSMKITNRGMIGTMVKTNMIRNSKSTILIADSTKYNSSGVIQLCSWNDIDCFICDTELDSGFLTNLKGLGVDIRLAPSANDSNP